MLQWEGDWPGIVSLILKAKVEVAEMPGHDTGKPEIDDWLARGNRLDDLSYSTLDEWAQESP